MVENGWTKAGGSQPGAGNKCDKHVEIRKADNLVCLIKLNAVKSSYVSQHTPLLLPCSNILHRQNKKHSFYICNCLHLSFDRYMYFSTDRLQL